MSATTSTVSNFVSALASRRSIYPLAKGAVIPDEKLIPLVQEIVKQSPSSFNSQSSRVVSDHLFCPSDTVVNVAFLTFPT